MLVKVTQEHIDDGCPGDPEYCPVALALHALGFAQATVGHETVRLHGGYSEKSIEMPGDAVRWIAEYDDEPRLGEPFSFELQL
jgi:hypothetical protein